jgi:hypothetical protein
MGVGLWFLIELGILKGTPGPNRFGGDPLAAVRSFPTFMATDRALYADTILAAVVEPPAAPRPGLRPRVLAVMVLTQ